MKSLPKKKKMVNHVAFLLDASGSMMGLTMATREVLAKLMDGLAAAEKKSGIETRVHIHSFGYGIRREVSNATPEAAARYYVYSARNEGTALIDSTIELVNTLEGYNSKTDDVSFLVYVLTDGQETENKSRGLSLKRILNGLNDDWTMAIMVPNELCKRQAESYGFPSDNIQVWETTAKGMEDLGRSVASTHTSYYAMRCAGQKSTKTLFAMNPVSKTEVKRKLDEVSPAEYETLLVRPRDDGKAIKDFVESWTGRPYRVGAAYYQVTKPEKIQGGKVVAVVEKATGKMYSGPEARKLIGLPDYEVKAEPANFKDFDLFVQSTSTNRKLVADTHLIVFK